MRKPVPILTAVLASFVATWSATATSSALAESERPTYSLRSSRTAGSLDRVEVTLEAGGELRMAEGDKPQEGKTTAVKMSAVAGLTYDEKTLQMAGGDRPLRSVRSYDRAAAVVKVGDDGTKPELREDRRLIAVEINGPKATLFCPRGILTREELDLVDVVGNSLLLDQLLPEKPVALGDAWKHPDAVVAALCGIETVRSNEVRSMLKEVDDQVAKIELSGRVEGTASGQATKIEIKAKYQFQRNIGRISWFGLLVQEDRSAGPMGPGLDVLARLRMKIGAQEKSESLSDAALRGLALDSAPELEQLSYVSPGGGWQIAYDRRWVLIRDKRDEAVFRLADRGAYLAECTVTETATTTGGKPVALEQFQEDIQHVLGKNFRQFVKAAEVAGGNDYHVYRVVAQGEVSDTPVQWIYYLIADKPGHRAVAAFTIHQSAAASFEPFEQQLARALRFLAPKVAARE